EIESLVIKTDEVEFVAIFAHERSTKPPARADDCNLHLQDGHRATEGSVFLRGAISNGKFSLAVVHKFDLDNRNINTVPRAQATVATRIDCRCTNECFRRALPEN